MNDLTLLNEELNKWNIDISKEQISMFAKYYELLLSWNEKINLTSVTDLNGVIYKHFLDSISIFKSFDLSGSKIIDVGTGAGFPGLPIAIMNHDCKVSLLDSLNKRVNFLNEVIAALGLNNVTAFHGRAEDFAHDKRFRENFDFSVSRAVANLSTLSEYCIPFVKPGGKFIAYKSSQSDAEINASKKSVSTLGGKITSIEEYVLPYDGNINNRLIVIDKFKPTPRTYPRKAGTPSKLPL